MVNQHWTPIRESTIELLDATDLYVGSATKVKDAKRGEQVLGAALVNTRRAYLLQVMHSRSSFFRRHYLRNALRRKKAMFLRARARFQRATNRVHDLRLERHHAQDRMAGMKIDLREQMEQFFSNHDDEVVIMKVEDVSAIRHMKQFREFELQFKFGTNARGSVQQYMIRQMFELSDHTLHMQPGQRYVMTEDGRFYLREVLEQEIANIF